MKTRYFTKDEFKCKCGCGLDVHEDLKYIADMGRHLCGFPWGVNSGARCLAHNRKIGSSDTSSHIKGLAHDVPFRSSHEKFMIIKVLLSLGVTRIGINDKLNFIHYDIDKDKPQEVLFKY